MTPRYRDIPARGLAWLTSVLSTTAFAAAGGFALGFLALVFVGVAGVELAPMVWGSGVLDRMLRGTVGLAGAGFAACLGLGAALHGANRLLYVRQLAREAEAAPTLVAAWQGRSVIISVSPFFGLTTFAWWTIGLGVVAIIILFASSGGTSDGTFSVWAVIGVVSGVVASMVGLLVHVSVAWRPAWEDAAARIRTVWGNGKLLVPWSAEGDPTGYDHAVAVSIVPRRLKRIARVTARLAAAAGAVGGAIFLLGLYLRQPCRGCAQNSYDRPGEAAINVLMAAASVLTVLAIAVFVLAILLEWIEDVVLQAKLARLARDGAAAPPDGVLAAALAAPWPGSTAGIALVVIGLGIGGVFGFASMVAPGIVPLGLVPVLLAIGAVGVLFIAWSVGAEARSRNRLRESWSVGDLVPARPPRRTRSLVAASDEDTP